MSSNLRAPLYINLPPKVMRRLEDAVYQTQYMASDRLINKTTLVCAAIQQLVSNLNADGDKRINTLFNILSVAKERYGETGYRSPGILLREASRIDERLQAKKYWPHEAVKPIMQGSEKRKLGQFEVV